MVSDYEPLLWAVVVAMMLVLTAEGSITITITEVKLKLKLRLEVWVQRAERWLARLFLHKD